MEGFCLTLFMKNGSFSKVKVMFGFYENMRENTEERK